MTHEQKKLLNEVMKYQFAVLDIALFLDTHPNDPVALRHQNKYTMAATQLKDEYERKYGPLTYYYPSKNYWDYIKSPWPWEIKY